VAEDDVLGIIETQVALLMRLGEATRRSTRIAPHRALDRSAYVILRHLQDTGPINVSALADRLNLDGSTVTRQVTTLENDGLVERRRDPKDGRGIVIAPTELGFKQVDTVRKARHDVYDRVLRDWDESDREGLATVLERFTGSLEIYMRETK
jgi:DNA-binding MarR family transcriptional regulator